MKLNAVEKFLMNNPVRAFKQKGEAAIFEKFGGKAIGQKVLEIGCGRGVGVEIIFKRFGAGEVKATKKLFESSDNLPISIVIDDKGNIIDRIDGVIFTDEFDTKVKPLLIFLKDNGVQLLTNCARTVPGKTIK